MSTWKLVANFAIPPAVVLTLLLIIPLPAVVRKGLLIFTQKVLFFQIGGGLKLAHFMMFLTGMSLTAMSFHTYNLSTAVLSDTLTANQRTALLAKKWREERNFWISLLAFALWVNLTQLYRFLLDYTQLKDRNRLLEAQLARLTAAGDTKPPLPEHGGVPAEVHAEPSAPPAPSEARGGVQGLLRRATKKAA